MNKNLNSSNLVSDNLLKRVTSQFNKEIRKLESDIDFQTSQINKNNKEMTKISSIKNILNQNNFTLTIVLVYIIKKINQLFLFIRIEILGNIRRNLLFSICLTVARFYGEDYIISCLDKLFKAVFQPNEADILIYNYDMLVYHHSKRSLLGKISGRLFNIVVPRVAKILLIIEKIEKIYEKHTLISCLGSIVLAKSRNRRTNGFCRLE